MSFYHHLIFINRGKSFPLLSVMLLVMEAALQLKTKDGIISVLNWADPAQQLGCSDFNSEILHSSQGLGKHSRLKMLQEELKVGRSFSLWMWSPNSVRRWLLVAAVSQLIGS